MKSELFSRIGENLRPAWRFSQLWPSQMRFGENVLLMTWKERFVQFSWKAHSFSFFARISGQCDYFENFDAQTCDLAKHAIWPKRVAHDLKTAFCPIFMESALFFRFEETLRRVSRFWELWREFKTSVTILTTLTLQNASWPKRAAHDLNWAFCIIFMESAVFPFWGQFQASLTILRTLTLKKCDWPKCAAHDLKRAFCTIFMKSALFRLFEENLRPVRQF